MCGRYTLQQSNPKEFVEKFGPFEGLTQPRFNRAPGQAHPIVIDRNHQASWTLMQWGGQSRMSRGNFFPINARSETILEKEIFRESVRRRRCLIPASGWYEWQVLESERYPHFLQLEESATFAMAGAWIAASENSEQPACFTILTRSAPSEILQLHHRAPLIIPAEHWDSWLSPNLQDNQIRSLATARQPKIRAHQVSSQVNSTKNDGIELLKPECGKQSLLF